MRHGNEAGLRVSSQADSESITFKVYRNQGPTARNTFRGGPNGLSEEVHRMGASGQKRYRIIEQRRGEGTMKYRVNSTRVQCLQTPFTGGGTEETRDQRGDVLRTHSPSYAKRPGESEKKNWNAGRTTQKQKGAGVQLAGDC